MFRTCSGRTKGSQRAATHAGPITRAVDAISGRSLERGGFISRGSVTELLSAAGITQTPTVGSSRGGQLESAYAIAPYSPAVPGVPAVAALLSRNMAHNLSSNLTNWGPGQEADRLAKPTVF